MNININPGIINTIVQLYKHFGNYFPIIIGPILVKIPGSNNKKTTTINCFDLIPKCWRRKKRRYRIDIDISRYSVQANTSCGIVVGIIHEKMSYWAIIIIGLCFRVPQRHWGCLLKAQEGYPCCHKACSDTTGTTWMNLL